LDWFISDTHFLHTNIIKYCNRPFISIDEMDTTILNNINRLVAQDDTLWHLGDFAYGRLATVESITFIRNQIRCKNINLIVGNHDKAILKNDNLKRLFNNTYNYYLGYIDRWKFLMTHRPPALKYNTDDWNWEKTLWDSERSKNAICLHGHTHNNSHRNPHNLSVELWNYCPVSINEVVNRCTEYDMAKENQV